jgi:hypothetical protein
MRTVRKSHLSLMHKITKSAVRFIWKSKSGIQMYTARTRKSGIQMYTARTRKSGIQMYTARTQFAFYSIVQLRK